jgi:hypothetical protein
MRITTEIREIKKLCIEYKLPASVLGINKAFNKISDSVVNIREISLVKAAIDRMFGIPYMDYDNPSVNSNPWLIDSREMDIKSPSLYMSDEEIDRTVDIVFESSSPGHRADMKRRMKALNLKRPRRR